MILSDHIDRISDDIDMKPGPLIKIDKKSKTTSKKFGDEAMSKHFDGIAIFPVYSQFEAIWKPEFELIVFIITFCFTRTKNRGKKSLTQLSHHCLV